MASHQLIWIYPNGGRRRSAWDFLRRLSQQSHQPWCIFGILTILYMRVKNVTEQLVPTGKLMDLDRSCD